MPWQFGGKNFVVTGGFGCVGRALGAELASAGARIALVDRQPMPDEQDHIPNAVHLGSVDLGNPDSACTAFARARKELGGIDGLVNVAGGFNWETVESGTADTWDRMYAMNLRTAVVSSQAVLPYLLERGGGRITNIGAAGAIKAGTGMGAYAASKAGVASLTEALADELKDKGITVNAVLPSIVDTPANRADMPDADFTRWVSPRALAAVIAFLLSDDASPVTGACLPVTGRV